MLNPLLHPSHSSAPTSPICTRSIHSSHHPASKGRHGGDTFTSTVASSFGLHTHAMVSGSSVSVPLGVVFKSMTPPNVRRKKPPDINRRLSRIVKSRSVAMSNRADWVTEFPEGMREYVVVVGGGANPRSDPVGRRKNALRETASQPGSPRIPRIEIHDLCTGTGSEVRPWCPSSAQFSHLSSNTPIYNFTRSINSYAMNGPKAIQTKTSGQKIPQVLMLYSLLSPKCMSSLLV